jgi:hypothetical protein
MSLTNAIDLSAHQNPKLSFWTKYDIESNYDYGQIEVSTNNGSTWIPLPGLYTEPGTGSFQPNGEPLYDGLKSNWVKEEISLAGYNSNQVKLRFELKTDGSLVKDGWYVDDIAIMVYGIIPVELTTLTANVVNEKTKLEWQTASELNNSGFEIERFKDSKIKGLKNWEKIGFVNGKGTTTETVNYSFVDDELLTQKTFYRLKQIDFDGTFSYSDEVEVEVNTPLTFSLAQNYPNPFNPSTKISWQSPVGSWQSLKVYDILGNEVVTLVNEYRNAGNYEFDFNPASIIKNLVSGIYFYRLQAGSFVDTKKMLMIK